jgi:hypothetical protein
VRLKLAENQDPHKRFSRERSERTLGTPEDLSRILRVADSDLLSKFHGLEAAWE